MDSVKFAFASIYETFVGVVTLSNVDLTIKLISFALLSFVYVAYKLNYWNRMGLVNVASSVVTQFTQPFQFGDFELIRKYGNIVGIYEFLTPSLLVADPDLAWQVLVTDFYKFPNHRFESDGAPKINRNGLFALKYKPWKRVRPIVSSAFTSSKIKLMVPLIKTNVENLMENLELVAKSGKPVDVKVYFSAFTMDVILNAAFGTEVNALQNPENELVKRAQELFGRNVSLETIFFIICPSLAIKLNMSAFNYNSIIYLSNFVEKVIKQRIESGTGRDDLLQSMLDCMVNNDGNTSKLLTPFEVIDQGALFIIAGYETTAITMSQVAYYLALHPEFQQKLMTEIDSIDEDKLFDYEIIDKLKYLDAIVKESQRLSPTVPRLERRAVMDCQLGHVFVPKGTLVVIPVYAMHRDEANFENADQFIPERFLESNEKNRSFQPFASGPRNCVGMRFAVLEMKLCLVNILRRYKFETCPNTEIPLKYFAGQLVSTPKSVTLKIVKRE